MKNGATLDIARRRLGLSIAETADICGVAERTVNRWIREEQDIRPDAWQSLGALESLMVTGMEDAVGIAREVVTAGPFRLLHFRNLEAMRRHYPDTPLPYGAHTMMTSWIAEALEEEGIAVEIVWAD